MDNLEAIVAKCFSGVFPELPEAHIAGATPDSVAGWDSVATVTLLATLEQELGIEIDAADVDEFVSFKSIVTYVRRQKEAAAASQ